MREAHRRDEQFLEAWFGGRLQFDDMSDGRLDFAPLCSGHERPHCAGTRGVADAPNAVEGAVRDEPEHHCVQRIDVRPERAGEPYIGDGRQVRVFEQEVDTGPQCSFRKLDRAHVVLGDAELRLAVVEEDVRERPAVRDDVRHRCSAGSDRAVGCDHPGKEQFGDRFDDAGPADPGDGGGFGLERRIVAPEIRPDDPHPWCQGGAIDADPLDCADGRALATADLRTLERRAGGARCREDCIDRTQDDLGVGADVDQQLGMRGAMRSFGENRGCGVGADVTGDARQEVDGRVRESDVEIVRPGVDGFVGREFERCGTQRRRIDAEHEVMHDRIPDDHQVEHVRGIDRSRGDEFAREFVERGPDRRGQVLIAARVHHHVRDAAHEIFPEADLWVHPSRGTEHFARREIAQVTGDGRGTDVDGDAVDRVREPGERRCECRRTAVRVMSQRQRGCARLACERTVQPDERGSVDRANLQPVLLAHGQTNHPDETAAGRIPLQFHVGERDHGIHHEIVQRHGLAHHLPMDLAGGRHVDDCVVLEGGRTPEPSVRCERAVGAVVGLHCGRRGKRRVVRLDGPLGERTGGRQHLAMTADTSTAAHGVEVDAQGPGRVEHRRPRRDRSVQAGWSEHHAYVGHNAGPGS